MPFYIKLLLIYICFILFFHLYRIFFYCLCFPLYNIYPKYCKSYKKCQLTKSKTLSLKTITKELDFQKQLLFNEKLFKKRFFAACKQINRKIVSKIMPFITKALLILLMHFFAKNQNFLVKIVPLLKAIVWELCKI